MSIEDTGKISLGNAAGTNRSIVDEFGGEGQHSISEYYRDGSYAENISGISSETDIPASGEIKFSDFLGTGGFSTTGYVAIEHTQSAGKGRYATEKVFIEARPNTQPLVLPDGGGTIHLHSIRHDNAEAQFSPGSVYIYFGYPYSGFYDISSSLSLYRNGGYRWDSWNSITVTRENKVAGQPAHSFTIQRSLTPRYHPYPSSGSYSQSGGYGPCQGTFTGSSMASTLSAMYSSGTGDTIFKFDY